MSLISICGRKGRGKTTLSAATADSCEARLWIDPRGLIRRQGAVVVYSLRDLADAVDALAEGETDEVVFSPRADADLDVAFDGFADEVLRWIIQHPDLPLAVVVDEAKWYGDISARRSFMKAIKGCNPDLVDIIIAAHRPKDIRPDIRALLNRWILFHNTHPDDLKAIYEVCGPDVVAITKTLRDHEYVEWNEDTGRGAVSRYPCIWDTKLSTAEGAR